MLKFGLHKVQNMLKRSPVGDFDTQKWQIGNSGEIFAGTCLRSGFTKQGSCMVWIHGGIALTPLTG